MVLFFRAVLRVSGEDERVTTLDAERKNNLRQA